jgi:hypothetical protein
MHSRLINIRRGESHRRHALRLLSVCSLTFPSRVGLLCIGQQSKNWPPRWCQIMQIMSFKSHSQILPTTSASLLCSCTISLPMFSFFRCSASFSSPTRSSPFRLLLGTRRKFWSKVQFDKRGPISTIHVANWVILSLQVAFTYSLDKTNVQGGFPHPAQPIHASPMGMTPSFC